MQNNNVIPRLIVMSGIPGSGKTTRANSFKPLYKIISSDNIREELGDINDQSRNQDVFEIAYNRIRDGLINKENMIYDATNLSSKRRIRFLQRLKTDGVLFYSTCLFELSSFKDCCLRNEKRDRKVPEEVIKKMFLNMDFPKYSEGWNNIEFDWLNN